MITVRQLFAPFLLRVTRRDEAIAIVRAFYATNDPRLHEVAKKLNSYLGRKASVKAPYTKSGETQVQLQILTALQKLAEEEEVESGEICRMLPNLRQNSVQAAVSTLHKKGLLLRCRPLGCGRFTYRLSETGRRMGECSGQNS